MRSDPHPAAGAAPTLVLDVGSSATKLALARADQLVRLDTLPSSCATEAEWAAGLHRVLARRGLRLGDLSHVAVGSVVPRATEALRALGQRGQDHPPFRFVTADRAPIGLDYERPADLGADRIADAVGAVAGWGAPVVVVDVGTAITCDLVSPEGRFAGGAIAPGLETGLRGLVGEAPALAAVSASARTLPNGTVVGRSTRACLQVGVVRGAAALVDGLARDFQRIVGPCPVVATGGGAATIARYSETITAVDPDLTLRGILLASLGND